LSIDQARGGTEPPENRTCFCGVCPGAASGRQLWGPGHRRVGVQSREGYWPTEPHRSEATLIRRGETVEKRTAGLHQDSRAFWRGYQSKEVDSRRIIYKNDFNI
jgi:hypothetical protein